MTQEPESPPHRIRLLLVEDELSTLFVVREFFATEGYDVDCAASLRDASLLLQRHSYDAVITDLHLSAQRGEGLLAAQYARRHNPNACIVLLADEEADTTADDARRCGATLFQTRPVELGPLSRFISLAVGSINTGSRAPCARAPRA
jgi:DNA-binding response OmpR family regulator